MDLRVKKRLLYKRQELVYRRVRRVTQGKSGTWNLEPRATGRRHCEEHRAKRERRGNLDSCKSGLIYRDEGDKGDENRYWGCSTTVIPEINAWSGIIRNPLEK
jgi:hypothetical protein